MMHQTMPPPRGLRSRRGAALIDVIIGAIMLGVGLSVVIAVSSRAIATQTDGERRMTAAWLADEMLNLVLIEGPDQFRRAYDTQGRYEAPFEDFNFAVDIDDLGPDAPFRVTVTISWNVGRVDQFVRAETMIARRHGDPEDYLNRAPTEYIDRDQRHHERIFGEDDR